MTVNIITAGSDTTNNTRSPSIELVGGHQTSSGSRRTRQGVLREGIQRVKYYMILSLYLQSICSTVFRHTLTVPQ
jgi:hypothetical protein